ncbi:MAG TPA: hypothetical protein VFX11_07120, partial [Candidatus Kapabacteria bacterium]|nr:hypothetical protein [Candidatus Kapabacteria bacterium]
MFRRVRKRLNKLYQTRYATYRELLQPAADWLLPRLPRRVVAGAPWWWRWLGLYWLLAFLALHCSGHDVQLTAELRRAFGSTRRKYIAYLLGDRLLRHRDYTEVTQQLFRRATWRNCEIHANFRYIDFVVQVKGFRTAQLDLMLRRLSGKRLLPHLTRYQKTRLLIHFLQKNNARKISDISRQVGARYLDKFSGPLYLMHQSVRRGWVSDPHTQMGSEMYRQLVAARSRFEQVIRDNASSFCVVGNAPCELGLGKGPLIDSFNIVIRLNDYSTEEVADYGSRQTIWVRVANREVVRHHAPANQLVVFSANNFAVKRRDAYQYLLPLYLARKEFTSIPNHVYQDLIRQLGGLPSTGLAILYWIYKIIGPIPRRQIFGFTHLSDGSDFAAHYYKDGVEIGVHLHEWQRETLLMQ